MGQVAHASLGCGMSLKGRASEGQRIPLRRHFEHAITYPVMPLCFATAAAVLLRSLMSLLEAWVVAGVALQHQHRSPQGAAAGGLLLLVLLA